MIGRESGWKKNADASVTDFHHSTNISQYNERCCSNQQAFLRFRRFVRPIADTTDRLPIRSNLALGYCPVQYAVLQWSTDFEVTVP